MHIDLLTGKNRVFLVSHIRRHDFFPVGRMYASEAYSHIIPVQVAYGKGGIRIISICEGVPITKAHSRVTNSSKGGIDIVSDNLYKTRTDVASRSHLQPYDSCVTIPINGRCICGKCETIDWGEHEQTHKSYGTTGQPVKCHGCKKYMCCHCRNSLSCIGRGCNGVLQPYSSIHATYSTDKLSTDPFTFISDVHANNGQTFAYCPIHMPYFKHTATQAIADAVMAIISNQCKQYVSNHKTLVSGYVNIKEYN